MGAGSHDRNRTPTGGSGRAIPADFAHLVDRVLAELGDLVVTLRRAGWPAAEVEAALSDALERLGQIEDHLRV